jgi:hypothetical protein
MTVAGFEDAIADAVQVQVGADLYLLGRIDSWLCVTVIEVSGARAFRFSEDDAARNYKCGPGTRRTDERQCSADPNSPFLHPL